MRVNMTTQDMIDQSRKALEDAQQDRLGRAIAQLPHELFVAVQERDAMIEKLREQNRELLTALEYMAHEFLVVGPDRISHGHLANAMLAVQALERHGRVRAADTAVPGVYEWVNK